jgi:hypothetical protein
VVPCQFRKYRSELRLHRSVGYQCKRSFL